MNANVMEPKRGADVGRVVVRVRVKNYTDMERSKRGEITPEAIRTIELDGLVDTGATSICLPKSLVEQLGLTFVMNEESRTVAGPITLGIYAPAWFEVDGPHCQTPILALPEGRQVLLGQIPLEMMDWWIDVTNQRLTGNPEHGGEWMAEV